MQEELTEGIEKLHIQRVTETGKEDVEDIVVQEFPLTIVFNNRELVTLLCSPVGLNYLAVGFLSSEGLVSSRDEIKMLTVDDRRGIVRVETVEDKELAADFLFRRFITSGCGRGASFYSAADVQNEAKVESRMEVRTSDIFRLVKDFQHRSEVYRTTGGVHSAALCSNSEIIVFSEDIGRHNAVDRIFGRCLLEGTATDNSIIITSGRISSEILLKVSRRKVPVLISKSAPTSLGVKLANDMGITLIGFARGRRMNVYTNGWRVITDAKE